MKKRIIFILNTAEQGGATMAFLKNVELLLDNIVPLVILPCEGTITNDLRQKKIDYRILKYGDNVYPNIYTLRTMFVFIRKIFYNKTAVSKLVEISKLFKPDIIHTNVGNITIGYEVSKIIGIPHVWHIRECLFGMKLFPTFHKHINKYKDPSNNCIAITNSIKDYFQLKGNVQVIYDGVLNSALPPSCKFNEKLPYIAFVGRLERQKGALDIVKAFHQYTNRGGRFNLHMVAALFGNQYVDIINYIRENHLQNRIFLLGYKNNVFDILAQARAMVMASYNEGFGFTTVEAMYNRCLVIGRDEGGTKEQFDNGYIRHGREIGLRFKSNSEIPDLLLSVECNDYFRIIEDAYETVNALYTVNEHSSKLIKYYDLF